MTIYCTTCKHFDSQPFPTPQPPDMVEDWKLVSVNNTCDRVFWTWELATATEPQQNQECSTPQDIYTYKSAEELLSYVSRAIDMIRSNTDKQQYLNALCWATDVSFYLQRLLSIELRKPHAT
jgi:hypothetical protein